VPIRHRNFRANFAAAMRVGKAANAGQANVMWTALVEQQ